MNVLYGLGWVIIEHCVNVDSGHKPWDIGKALRPESHCLWFKVQRKIEELWFRWMVIELCCDCYIQGYILLDWFWLADTIVILVLIGRSNSIYYLPNEENQHINDIYFWLTEMLSTNMNRCNLKSNLAWEIRHRY